jgi:hypothetical protein
MTFSYTVTGDFEDAAVAEEWVAWLQHGHLAEVLAGGALEAVLVRLAPSATAPLRFEVRYRFADAAAFARYEQEHAPRLRAESLAKFPASRGVRMSRSTGEILDIRGR